MKRFQLKQLIQECLISVLKEYSVPNDHLDIKYGIGDKVKVKPGAGKHGGKEGMISSIITDLPGFNLATPHLVVTFGQFTGALLPPDEVELVSKGTGELPEEPPKPYGLNEDTLTPIPPFREFNVGDRVEVNYGFFKNVKGTIKSLIEEFPEALKQTLIDAGADTDAPWYEVTLDNETLVINVPQKGLKLIEKERTS